MESIRCFIILLFVRGDKVKFKHKHVFLRVDTTHQKNERKKLPTDSTGEFACALLQQSDYLGFLSGGAAATDHSGTLTRKLHELVLVIFEANLQGTDQNGKVSEQKRPHEANLNCRSQSELKFSCGLKPKSNRRHHFQRGFSRRAPDHHAPDTSHSLHVQWGGYTRTHFQFTSSESPDITSAQSCFLLKALSSRWASPRVVTYQRENHIQNTRL